MRKLAITTAAALTALAAFCAWGEWVFEDERGGMGPAPGRFRDPWEVALASDGRRLYVTDTSNYRVQYFRWSDPAVAPTSLGKVKALFR